MIAGGRLNSTRTPSGGGSGAGIPLRRRAPYRYTLAAGLLIGGVYEVAKPLGHGGMGEVYLVRHKRLNILRAIKTLLPKVVQANQSFAERFMQEARMAIQLEQENIVRVMDAQYDSRLDLYYIVMEYVDGGTVRSQLKAGRRFEERRALEIALDVARALAIADRQKIVHRDIKPDNIMLTSEGKVKVADLGIAKSSENSGSEESLSQGIALVGTPSYISPEQIVDAEAVDCRADIYSLGVSLYEMLSGVKPFQGQNTQEILDNVLHASPPALDHRISSVSWKTSELVHSMMARERERRPRDWNVVMERIQLILDPEGASAASYGGTYGRISKVLRILPVVAPVLVLLLLLAGYNILAATQWAKEKSLSMVEQVKNHDTRRAYEFFRERDAQGNQIGKMGKWPPLWRCLSRQWVKDWVDMHPISAEKTKKADDDSVQMLQGKLVLSFHCPSAEILTWLKDQEIRVEATSEKGESLSVEEKLRLKEADGEAGRVELSLSPGSWIFKVRVEGCDLALRPGFGETTEIQTGVMKSCEWDVHPMPTKLRLHFTTSSPLPPRLQLQMAGEQNEIALKEDAAEIEVPSVTPLDCTLQVTGFRNYSLHVGDLQPGKMRESQVNLIPLKKTIDLTPAEQAEVEAAVKTLHQSLKKPNSQNFQKAYESLSSWHGKSAEADYLAGVILEMRWDAITGFHTEMTDEKRTELCLEHYEAAVSQDYGCAYYHLGHIYEYGIMVPRNSENAMRFYQAGSEVGDARCLRALAKQSLNMEMRKELLSRAFAEGNLFAQSDYIEVLKKIQHLPETDPEVRKSREQLLYAVLEKMVAPVPEQLEFYLQYVDEFPDVWSRVGFLKRLFELHGVPSSARPQRLTSPTLLQIEWEDSAGNRHVGLENWEQIENFFCENKAFTSKDDTSKDDTSKDDRLSRKDLKEIGLSL